MSTSSARRDRQPCRHGDRRSAGACTSPTGSRVPQGADGGNGLRHEAENLSRFREHFRDYPRAIRARADLGLSSRRVLTMELVTGTRSPKWADFPHGTRPARTRRGAAARLPRPGVRARRHPCRPAPGQPAGDAGRTPGAVRSRHGRARAAAAARPPVQAAVRRGRRPRRGSRREAIAMGTRLEDFDEERFMREVGRWSRATRRIRPRRPARAGCCSRSCASARPAALRPPSELRLLGKTLRTWRPRAGRWIRAWT